MNGKVGVDLQLSNVGRDVEEEREPADPIKELGFAHFADLRIEALHRVEDLTEEGHDTKFFL